MPKNKTQQNRAPQPIAGSGNARKAAKDFRLAPAKRQYGRRTRAAKTKTGKAGPPCTAGDTELACFLSPLAGRVA
ncbi:hypothetical protein [Pseudomonas sp. FFUP_PS_473]|jgi:hypothetical protein|uniref:hypothetical protein n=1 Tax=Pseudomonas sp. FFUP_PS_473 TaxID=2060418 RepID=UPI0011AE6238|nr:hypothetical protein [Pseudomonas sp. FFUP_PS_473]